MCLLTENILDYHFVSQGKTTIPNMDDGEEFTITDVSISLPGSGTQMVAAPDGVISLNISKESISKDGFKIIKRHR